MREVFIEYCENEKAWLLKTMKERFGDEANQVFLKTSRERVCKEWSKIAENAGDNSIESLIKQLWETRQGEYTLEETDVGFQVTCTKCIGADIARRLGIADESYTFSCAADPFIVEGFNPNIGFKRTKTLMQSHDCCDHFYYYIDKSR